jgi:hypothetical protein
MDGAIIFPLKKTKYYGFNLFVPKLVQEYCERVWYGKGAKDTVYVYNHSIDGPEIKIENIFSYPEVIKFIKSYFAYVYKEKYKE